MARTDASHLLKLQRHMTQIIVPVRQGDGHQVYLLPALFLHMLYRLMEPAQAHKLLRRNAHIGLEHPQKLPFTQARHTRHLRGGDIPFLCITSRHHFAHSRVVDILFVRQMAQEERIHQHRYLFRFLHALEDTVQLQQSLISVLLRRQHFPYQLLQVHAQQSVHTSRFKIHQHAFEPTA